ncbi:phenazine biosynthesis FMN-dependent oxidase PhzG [Barrientosiimonas humi]|uniref:phenazine biosynthesis FMN-dependent oxidase PhzG n=1 Tax=Barrientosiimonas humi TaxID=999931 RepID=UPI00370DAB11
MTAPWATPAEFDAPPADPVNLLREWLAAAISKGVRDPHHMALATADAQGRASNRTVAVSSIRDEGVVFATHNDSPKGRDLAETGWASGLLYWREASRQVIVTGPTSPLPSSESDRLWAERPIAMHPMSVASKQSAPLEDEASLRARARELGRLGKPLPRPATWVGYLLTATTLEFWQSGDPDRFYLRLLYRHGPSGWRASRLQP